jgi:hypothetical protein
MRGLSWWSSGANSDELKRYSHFFIPRSIAHCASLRARIIKSGRIFVGAFVMSAFAATRSGSLKAYRPNMLICSWLKGRLYIAVATMRCMDLADNSPQSLAVRKSWMFGAQLYFASRN